MVSIEGNVEKKLSAPLLHFLYFAVVIINDWVLE